MKKKLSHFRLIRNFGSAVKDIVKRPYALERTDPSAPRRFKGHFHQEQAVTQSDFVANRCTRSLDGKNRDGASGNKKKQSVSGPVLETKQNRTEENGQSASKNRKKPSVSSPVLETE